ncbi:MAG TPA: hypothetical protein VGR26_02810 [Acidimicrobiales bacterium]|nr:hypothetical protein [Acidimicrobiales bacterium]
MAGRTARGAHAGAGQRERVEAATSTLWLGGVGDVEPGWWLPLAALTRLSTIRKLMTSPPMDLEAMGTTGEQLCSGEGLLVDERHFYQINAADPVDPNKLSTHPVTLHDYRRMQFMDALRRYEAVRRDDPTYVEMVMLEVVEQRSLVHAHQGRDVVTMGNLGIFGYAVGDRAFLADAAGLADPIAARIQIPEDVHRGKPGHEKGLPLVWFRARFTSPTADDAERLPLGPCSAET